jgi:hypothetical protein
LNTQEARDTALKVAATTAIGSFGYQQAVQNLQETIIEIASHLSLTYKWFTTTLPIVELTIAFVVLLFAMGIRMASLTILADTDEPGWTFAVFAIGGIAMGAIGLFVMSLG